jgi:hypothetical protein
MAFVIKLYYFIKLINLSNAELLINHELTEEKDFWKEKQISETFILLSTLRGIFFHNVCLFLDPVGGEG